MSEIHQSVSFFCSSTVECGRVRYDWKGSSHRLLSWVACNIYCAKVFYTTVSQEVLAVAGVVNDYVLYRVC